MIYNFSIIAHIDHGKSTLADRMLELTQTVADRDMQEQLLDDMELEREKGITIKLRPVRMQWEGHVLNLIDTPGHVDFQYEVSRSLQAVEGAILLVDATQGIQAQTIANLYLALEQDLKIISVINKIDLPAADVPKVEAEIRELLGEETEMLHISAKTGEGVAKVLEAVLEQVPAAEEKNEVAARALIFDSVYDDYKGVVAYVRVVEGEVSRHDNLYFCGTKASDKAVELGYLVPKYSEQKVLKAGEIGYIATGLKDVRQARVGDTITLEKHKDDIEVLAGFEVPQAKVFAGFFPQQGDKLPELRQALDELQLNDASLLAEPEQNVALGQGFRCGFLGMLHMEIIQERIKREYGIELVATSPSVTYKIHTKDGVVHDVTTPSQWPDPGSIELIEEPLATADIYIPDKFLGPVFEMMQEREGVLGKQEHLEGGRVHLQYALPLRELVVDLYDQLKSATSGYGSLSYEISDWQPAEVVKLSVLVNHEPVEALASIVAKHKAEKAGRRLVKILKDAIPRQLFAVPVQAAIGGSIVARETVPAMRKDVTAKLYGGDVTRKRKLLEKQKKGKKKMAGSMSVELPSSVYTAVLKRG